MAEVIGIKFREDGRVYSFEANGITLAEGDRAIVETSRGIECGTVAKSNFIQDDAEISKPLKPVLRAATEDDLKRVAQNKEKEKRAFSVCEQKIAARKLDKAASKGVIHKNQAANRKSGLALKINAM